MQKIYYLFMFSALGASVAACGSDDFYAGSASAALGSSTNEATCATCHALDDSAGFSGNTFKDIAYRTSFKGDPSVDLLGGANACITGWMGGTAITADSAAFVELQALMQSISDASVTTPNAIMPEVLANEAAYEAAYAGGDAAAGAATYETYCGDCHEGGLNVGGAVGPSKAVLAMRTAGRIAQKVRTAGPPPSSTEDAAAGTDNTSGPMPFFEMKDLSADDLKNIIAYLKN